MTRVLIVDDEQLLRQGIALVLRTQPELEVVGEAADGAEALTQIERCHPDVVLTDARMPGTDGIGLVRAARKAHPDLPVIILTTFDDEDLVLGSLGAGAAGFLLKDVSPETLGRAIAAALRGELVIDPRVARLAVGARPEDTDEDPLAVLTSAEHRVAALVARGLSNAEIAADLVLSEGTVKNHVSALLRKLGQPNRTALALLLHRCFGDR
ncbi:response regulator [Parenemella sanctibonifatiensis]|uniref:DNA-binding response regulator n=1 Tax=Parenemella sanctibonifatiensis TaxID=2016505 RepID=A0A255EG27_9ACTN|nr:response regulator transcription factor [Parenemella sanctibonifatiensis]OYN90476.1 DNA-binding response regulator [Parenemella sanctibonifatiensis]